MVVIGRRVIEAPVKMPVEAMMPVVGVTIAAIAQPAVAIAAAAVDVRSTKTAAAERHAAAPKTAAMERSTAASKTAAVKGRAATTAPAKTTAAMATVTAAYFDRHCFGCVFGCRHRARTCQRQRFSALLRCGRQRKHGGSRQSRTADNAPRGT